MVRCLLYSPLSQTHLADVPVYRTLVRYVPQRPSLLPGTPLDFLTTIRSFASRRDAAKPARGADGSANGYEMASRSAPAMDPLELAEGWGIEKVLWSRDWSRLSGGEAQRIALAAAIGLGGADVILLDGTSAVPDIQSRTGLMKQNRHRHWTRRVWCASSAVL